MTPNYVARRSVWACIGFWRILACILVIPLLVLIVRIIATKKFAIEFYDDKIIVREGWLNTRTKQMVFMGVTAVSVNQSLWGKLCNYGDVMIDCVGKWDVRLTTYIKNPKELESYLQQRIVPVNPQAQMASRFVEM